MNLPAIASIDLPVVVAVIANAMVVVFTSLDGVRMAPSSITIKMFGAFTASRESEKLRGLHLREGERLLAYLILHGGFPVTSSDLAKRFWPFEAQGMLDGQTDFPSVRQAIFALRQALGDDADLLTRPSKGSILLDVTGLKVDVMQFDRLIQEQGAEAAIAWETAVGLYKAPLLQGWTDGWAVQARKRYQREYERCVRRLALLAQQNSDRAGMERWLQLLLSHAPDDEDSFRVLLRSYAAGNRLVDSRDLCDQIETAVRAVGRELTAETSAAILETRKSAETLTVASEAAPSPIQEPVVAPSVTPGPGLKNSPTDDQREAPGGAMPVDSHFYIERETDSHFNRALLRGDSIVLIKGPRQVGKTSLMARSFHQARQAGARVVLTDLQKLNEAQFESSDSFYQALCSAIALQLDVEVSPRKVWDDDYGPNMNMELFLRRYILTSVSGPLIWGIDEVDRLFTRPFGSEVFGLFRSWHNERSLDPSSPWSRLTLAIAYATEAHLFISDLNQSPFNVGTRLELTDFVLDHVTRLNIIYGRPIEDAKLAPLMEQVGGHPYLVRCTLEALCCGSSPESIEALFEADNGPFGDHFRRIGLLIQQSPDLLDAVGEALKGRSVSNSRAFYRLRSAGLLSGANSTQPEFRCGLYRRFLSGIVRV